MFCYNFTEMCPAVPSFGRKSSQERHKVQKLNLHHSNKNTPVSGPKTLRKHVQHSTNTNKDYDNLLVEANTGPKALARAPSDLNIPIIVPFWSSPPYMEITVVRHGTTVADAGSLQKKSLIFF